MKTVPLYGRKAAGRVALVDDEDYELVMRYRWNVYDRGEPGQRKNGPYAVTRVPVRGGRTCRQATLQMHVLIMGAKGVDHADHNGLNNQRANLRVATQVQNGGNQRPRIGKTSAYKGVHWDKMIGKWRAGVRVNKKHISLGTFTSELEAAYAYDGAAREAFGEFAWPNFPDGPAAELAERWRRAEDEASLGVERTCQECGQGYRTRAPGRSRFCGRRCADKARYGREREERAAVERIRTNRTARGGTSSYNGVSWHRQGRKWMAQIRADGTHRYLGLFTFEEDAARAYDAAAREAWGEFAHLNFPGDPSESAG